MTKASYTQIEVTKNSIAFTSENTIITVHWHHVTPMLSVSETDSAS